jgi:SM-20-related protein
MVSAATAMPGRAAAQTSVLDIRPLLAARRQDAPYPWVTASGCLRPGSLPSLERDFPVLPRPGYHPVRHFTPRGAFADLLAEIEGGALDGAMKAHFGIDAAALPRLVTVQQTSAARAGRPHTDSPSKVATLLIYVNSGWVSPEGRIRVLRREALEDPVAEIGPQAGNVFAFLRSDHSWHGHTPFAGERRVVQVAWLRDAADLDRKQRNHRLGWLLKGLRWPRARV